MNATAVIVDGYSTGNFLPEAFARLGVSSVHVQSTPELIGSLAPPLLRAYRDNIVCQDTGLDAVVAALAPYRPEAVVAGAEFGVPLADAISERLGLASNGTALSAARRDKYEMIEALRAKGIRCARQIVSDRPEEILAWAWEEGISPVVVKPVSSSGSDNVHICADAAAVLRAARAVLAARDLFQQPNTVALAQSLLDGPEYIVDVVGSQGDRYVSGVWEYRKRTLASGRRIYDREVLCDPRAEPVAEIIDYVGAVLDALDVRHGAAHAEVIMTAGGPALVEAAARLNGGMNPGFQTRCLGIDQASLTALAYARPREFRARYGGRTYTKQVEACVHDTSTQVTGLVTAVDREAVAAIEALPTVHHVQLKSGPGKRLRPTVDLPSSPLAIHLVGDSAEALDADLRAIDRLKDLVYRVA